MTKEKAVSLLRRYGRDAYRYQTNGYVLCAKRNVGYQVSVYGRFLVDYLIREIKKSVDDPIHTIQGFYSYLDWVLGDSDDDHFETHRFASRMEYETGNILRYLENDEKERKEDAESGLERNRR